MAERTPNDLMDPRRHSGYWLSYALDHHMNADEILRNDLFRLAIILDPALQKVYSKIQLVIVDENPHEVTNDVSIRATPWRVRAWGHEKIPGTKPIKPINQTRRSLPPKSTKSVDGSKPCVVVLLLQWHIWRRSLYHDFEVITQDQLQSSPKRILLDQIYEGVDLKPSLFLLLETSHAFTYYFIEPQRATIRILPLNPSSRSPCPLLPPTISLRIAEAALEGVPDNLWASSLLSLALVRKSWLHVVDLFYKKAPDRTVAEPHTVWCSLQRNLTKACLLKSFSIKNVNPYDFPGTGDEDNMTDEEIEEVRRQLYDISFLRHGIHIRELVLNWDFVLLAMQSHILEKLVSVENFTLTGWGSQVDSCAPLGDILKAISGWSKLDRLTLNKWLKENPDSPPLPACSYSLTTLTLCSGPLSRIHISHLTSHPSPALTTLHLTHVTAVNADLAVLFIATALTLETIDISDCQISPPKSPQDEEFALEAHISKMTRLKELHIPGGCCTYYVISRKSESINNPRWVHNTRIHIEGASWKSFFRGQRDGKALIKQAMESTGWRNIRIEPERSEGFWNNAVDSLVEEIANKRNINLMIGGPRGSL